MSEQPVEKEPVLDIARGDAAVSRQLRSSLEVLRSKSDNEDFRRMLGDVLEGRSSLREAALTNTFSQGITPYVEEGLRRYEEMSEEERDGLAAQGQAELDRLREELADPPAGPATP